MGVGTGSDFFAHMALVFFPFFFLCPTGSLPEFINFFDFSGLDPHFSGMPKKVLGTLRASTQEVC